MPTSAWAFHRPLPVLRRPYTRFCQNSVIAERLVAVRHSIRENSTMNSDDTTRTSSTLLRRIADWQDHAAWRDFVARYEPYIRSWCREYRLDDEMAKEVSQDFWLKLAEQDAHVSLRPEPPVPRLAPEAASTGTPSMRSASGVGRKRSSDRSMIRPGSMSEACPSPPEPLDEEDDEPAPRRLRLLDLAEQVQAAVRDKVQPQTWQAFWHIAIDGWTPKETAKTLNMSLPGRACRPPARGGSARRRGRAPADRSVAFGPRQEAEAQP